MIQRLIAFLARHATAVLAIGVLAGLALPSWSAVARPALGPAVWLLLVVAVIRVDWPQIRAHLRRRALLGAAMVWMLVGAPLAMWAVLGNTALAPGLVTAMVLMAGSSPINSAPALALLLGLDGALSLLLLLAQLLLLLLSGVNRFQRLRIIRIRLPIDFTNPSSQLVFIGQIGEVHHQIKQLNRNLWP